MTFTAQYFSFFSGLSGSGTGLFEATLTDVDLIRGNNENETIEDSTGLPIFNGFFFFEQTGTGLDDVVRVFEDGEATTTVTFNDGTTLSNVLALNDFRTFSFGASSNNFLLDQNALASVGKTIADVADVSVDAFIDHDLSFADLGFGDATVIPPEPEPGIDVIAGTDGRDRLTGTDADEVLIGGGDSDRLTGNGGADTFVFGADTNDGARDRDVILDFDIADDTLVLEASASIRRVVERNGDTIIRLEGDNDAIVLRDVTAFSLDDIVFAEDVFLA